MGLGPVWIKIGMTINFSVLKTDCFQFSIQRCCSSRMHPDVLPWVAWCYGSHPFLWHPMCQLTSQSGIQQGDPLGPFHFALVLHKVAGAIKRDTECSQLSYQTWYLNNGILAGIHWQKLVLNTGVTTSSWPIC